MQLVGSASVPEHALLCSYCVDQKTDKRCEIYRLPTLHSTPYCRTT